MQVHLVAQTQKEYGLLLSNSSHITRNFVKYYVMEESPCLIATNSRCKSKILGKSPCKYHDFKFFQMSTASSSHKMLCLIEVDTKCTNHETTILLHFFYARNNTWFDVGLQIVPSMNYTLFSALNVVGIDLLHEF